MGKPCKMSMLQRVHMRDPFLGRGQSRWHGRFETFLTYPWLVRAVNDWHECGAIRQSAGPFGKETRGLGIGAALWMLTYACSGSDVAVIEMSRAQSVPLVDTAVMSALWKTSSPVRTCCSVSACQWAARQSRSQASLKALCRLCLGPYGQE